MVIQAAVVNVPNASNVFSNLAGVCPLKLRQLRVPLDFKEDFLSGGRHDLRIRDRRGKKREIEAEIFSIYWSDRATEVSKERTYLDVDRCIGILRLYLVLVLLGVGHGVGVASGDGRV